MPASYTGQQLTVADGITLALGAGTLNTNDTFGAAAFTPQLSVAQDATVQVGNQIVTSSSNQVTNAINGVTLDLSGTGGPSVVTVAPDITTEANQISAFVSAYNTAVNDTPTTPRRCPIKPLRRWPTMAACARPCSTCKPNSGTLNLSTLGISVDQQTGNLVFDQAQFVSSGSSNPSAVNTEIGQLYSSLNPTVSYVVAPSSGLIATETANDQAQTTQLASQINTLTTQEQQEQQLLQTEFAQIQAVVATYQSLSQLFTDNSTSSSSSSSSTPAPGSNLSLSG